MQKWEKSKQSQVRLEMVDFVKKIKKGIEEGYETVRNNATNIKDMAGDYSKIAKLKFELHQLKTQHEKKLALLGTTVFPYLLENNTQGLKTHETLQMLLDEIKNISNQIELVQHAVTDISTREKQESKPVNMQKIRNQIEDLEHEIEQRLSEIQAVKDELDK